MEKKPSTLSWSTWHHLQLYDLLPSRTLFFIPWNLQDLYFGRTCHHQWSVPNTLILEFFDSLTSKALLSPVPYCHLQLFHSQVCFITTHSPSLLPAAVSPIIPSPSPFTESPQVTYFLSSLFSQWVSYSMTHCLNHSFCYIESLQHQSN